MTHEPGSYPRGPSEGWSVAPEDGVAAYEVGERAGEEE